MKRARIYQRTRSAMQSGRANTKQWYLEFSSEDKRFIEPIMGWVGSSDMSQELRLLFDTKEDAIQYAESKDIEYEISLPQKQALKIKSYAKNFK